jgi:hypothetical protein
MFPFAQGVAICAVVSFAGAASAATVDFRIVERRGQTSWDPFIVQSSPLNDNILNLAVQARVRGGALNESLGNFAFNIIMPGEAETDGTLTKGAISNTDGTYNTSATQYNNSSTIGRGGLSAIYSYLAGIGSDFNGLINLSGGNWTQTPNQDIGKITGSPTGGSLLLLADPAMTSNPATYPGTGTTAPLDPAIANTYLAANGNWVDVYHFNYTITSQALRGFHFTLDSTSAQTFTSLSLVNSVWGADAPLNAQVTATGLDLQLVPAPATLGLLPAGVILLGRRSSRRGV